MIIYQALSVTRQSYISNAERGDTERDAVRPAVTVKPHSEYQQCHVAM